MIEILKYLAEGYILQGGVDENGFYKPGGLSHPLMMVILVGGTILALLPESPFRVLVNWTLDIPEARYWGWIIPIREFSTFFEAVASCYYIFAMLYALLKYCNIVK